MMQHYVRTSPADARYFEQTDGTPFIPIGINLCFPRFLHREEEILDYYRKHITALAENGGNFLRLWLSSPFFELEKEGEGLFDERQLNHIAAVVNMAEHAGVRLKLTLEHFRTLADQRQAESFPGAASFVKRIYHRDNGGSFADLGEFMNSSAGKALYLRKLDVLAARFVQSPAIMAWELWNEVNCTGPAEQWQRWTEFMLPELKKRFPHHLVTQSLGSFDSNDALPLYSWLGKLVNNELIQAHRYLDPGASLAVCRGPVDVFCADAILALRRIAPERPLLLAEAGAVEWQHSGPSHWYAQDDDGTILEDILFAPFFAGAAGPGQAWHWEEYIIPHQLWPWLGRFRQAVKDCNPAAERLQPFMRETEHLRVYGLQGKHGIWLWIRDRDVDWQTELEQRRQPEIRKGEQLVLRDFTTAKVSRAEFYLPRLDSRGALPSDNERVMLPDFRRSMVVKLSLAK